MNEQRILVDVDALRRLIDIALIGDGYASGWMDDEEIQTLRSVASAIGMDPDMATPTSGGHRCRYRKTHKWAQRYRDDGPGTMRGIACADCGQYARIADAERLRAELHQRPEQEKKT